MTTKILTGQLPSSYYLRAPVTELVVSLGASVAGSATYGIYTSTAATAGYVVLNEGTVKSGGPGILLNHGGTVTNGLPDDTTALIDGAAGVVINGAPGVVKNFGTIGSGSVANSHGVQLPGGGTIVNGSATDTTALIKVSSGHAIYTGLPGTVVNFGRIIATSTNSGLGDVDLSDGGRLTNELSGTLIARVGVVAYDYANTTTVTNLGTIDATKAGVRFTGGDGAVTNGSANDLTALIKGANGVTISGGAGTVTNFATIEGLGGAAVYFAGSGTSITAARITNGSAADSSALIIGTDGIDVNPTGAPVTVTNFGTIEATGTAGYAVHFAAPTTGPAATLVVEKGSDLIGRVSGGGGTLDLASGVGTISALAFGQVVFSGADSVDNFSVLEIGKNSRFTLSSTGTIGTGSVQTLIIDGELQVTGSLTVSGSVSGPGILAVNGGLATISGATAINVDLYNHGDLTLGDSQAYTGTIRGLSKTGGNHLDLLDVRFLPASKATYSGTATSGVLTVSDGAGDTAKIKLIGDYLGATWRLSSDGHGGVIVKDPPGATASAIVSAMASFAPAPASAHAPAELTGASAHPLLAASH